MAGCVRDPTAGGCRDRVADVGWCDVSRQELLQQVGDPSGGEVWEAAAGDGVGDGRECDGVGVGHPAGLVVGLELGFEVEQGAESVDGFQGSAEGRPGTVAGGSGWCRGRSGRAAPRTD